MVRSIGRLLAIAIAGLLCAACGGGDDGGGAGASERPTTTSRVESSGNDTSGIDYESALLSVDDLRFLTTDFAVVEAGDAAETVIRDLCGQESQGGLAATAGAFRQMIGSNQSASVTPSVRAFDSEADAKTAFAVATAQAEACENVTDFVDAEGATFEPLPSPLIQDAGDETVTLFARKTDTGLVVGDHLVRDGRFVYAIRFALSGTSPVTESIAGTIATEGSRKFENWTEEPS
jgi:hypothetical protein